MFFARHGFGRPEVLRSIADLKSSKAEERWKAADQLAAMGPKAKSAVPALLEALKDPEPNGLVSISAAKALLAILPNHRDVVPALVDAMDHSKGNAPVWMARLLIGIRPEGFEALKNTMKRDGESTETQTHALASTGQAGMPSHIFSLGSMLDVGWGDLIDFLGDDSHTNSILLYMESIGNAHAFLSAAREVALQKPIIVIKAGRTEVAAKAAASHTGALAGSEELLSAAFRRVGVVQVRRVAELFNLAEVLAKQPRPKGPNLAIVTNAGGPGVLATDALIEAGGRLATLSSATIEAMNPLLPPHWSHANPVDVLGDATAECYARCVEITARAAECDGLLAILAPQVMTDPTETAQRLTALPKLGDKPILANWMGGSQVAEGIDILNRASIPTFTYPR